jgi:hypothetical protein
MKNAAIVFSAAAALAIAATSIPKPAEARGGRGWGPAVVGGLLAGAVIGGLASSSYGYGPPYGYYGPGYGAYGYGAYGSDSRAYSGGYELDPGYYGYRRAYYGPRFYGGGW